MDAVKIIHLPHLKHTNDGGFVCLIVDLMLRSVASPSGIFTSGFVLGERLLWPLLVVSET